VNYTQQTTLILSKIVRDLSPIVCIALLALAICHYENRRLYCFTKHFRVAVLIRFLPFSIGDGGLLVA